jgi:hypothetical protein
MILKLRLSVIIIPPSITGLITRIGGFGLSAFEVAIYI